MKVVILADAPAALIELCGISLIERLLRALQRVEVHNAVILSSPAEALEKELARPSPPRSEIAFRFQRRNAGPVTIEDICGAGPDGDMLVVLPGDAVWGDRLLSLLITHDELAVFLDS